MVPSLNMVLLALVIVISRSEFTRGDCEVCVTQPLITSDVVCPVCATLDGKYVKGEPNRASEWLKTIGTPEYTDADNPNNWTTCHVEAPPCDVSYKYRSYDGSCNNLEHPTWGMANTAYTRILPSYYRDDKHKVGLAIDGNPRPISRILSTSVFPDGQFPDTATLVVMQWGQVVAHDLVITFPMSGKDNCCSVSEPADENRCLASIIPHNDYFYSEFNITCRNVQRNVHTHVGNNCNGGPAQQVNGITHMLDASLVYGSDVTKATSLRTLEGGRLKTQKLEDGREFLPNVPLDIVAAACNVRSISEPCYTAGDGRVNQNTELSALVNVLLRTHNSIAGKLEKLHLDWDDETLYQETRHILIAIVQHISYNEWLQYYIGKKTMLKHGLYPKKIGHTEYRSGINLISMNEFAAAAFRIGHSGLQGFLNKINHKHQVVGSIPMSDWMNRPLILHKGCNYDKFLRGVTMQRMQKHDRMITTQVTNLLLTNFKPYGDDLVSIDILRGRDHGLATYVHYLEVCTGFRADEFDDLKRVMTEEHVELLRENYKSIKDIDLMVGGTLEQHVDVSRLGPTFLCILTEQFYRTKLGDRFWYEVGGQRHSFSEEQLTEIRKFTLSKLICNGGDQITEMPLNSFLPVSNSNKLVKCEDIPGIDLSKF